MNKIFKEVLLFTIIFIILLVAFNIWLVNEQSKGKETFDGYTSEQCYNYYLELKNN